jgi:hypothetical protein
MLCALLSGRALTASELASTAHVTPQTASGHLNQLADAKLIAPLRQGRFRYYRIADPSVAKMLESIMQVAAASQPTRTALRMDPRMRTARLCYDHCAGLLGVGLADALCTRNHVTLNTEGGEVTETGAAFLAEFGVSIEALRRQKRLFCRPCLDWSERRLHIAGAVGASLAQRMLTLDWIKRIRGTRILEVTPLGAAGLRDVFGVSLDAPAMVAPASLSA